MTTEALRTVFNGQFLAAMTAASAAVLAIANTLGRLGEGKAFGQIKVSRLWAAFVAAEVLAIYAAYLGGWSWQLGNVLEVLVFGLILFCYAAGVQQSVLAIAQRFAGTKTADASHGWWSSWF